MIINTYIIHYTYMYVYIYILLMISHKSNELVIELHTFILQMRLMRERLSGVSYRMFKWC